MRLDFELGQSVSAIRVARRRRVLHRVPQRRGRIDRREHLAPRRLDVGFEPFDVALQRRA